MESIKKSFELFVPGRICIFGEHSDWAGGYRRTNSQIEKGCTLITGTNQGLFATVKLHPSQFVFHTTLPDGGRDSLSLPMRAEELLAAAQEGGFFSYVAGVAYQIMTHYHVGGIEIDNFKTDLPLRKGLSSSAAVCVLVARAFNRLYQLRMTVRGEMDFAYRGEITTPSRCGRMDQGCAYGVKPILMTFDCDAIDVDELTVGADLYFVIADLAAGKDTVRILRDLNRAFPFAETEVHTNVQRYLGPMNRNIVQRAVAAINKGDARLIGALMSEAQSQFDACLAIACPAELTAPVLHSVLSNPSLQPLIYGGKGVGSQGDGSVQFIARDAGCQRELVEILNNELHMPAMPLTIPRSRKIRKALITAAGYGTRLFPMTKIIRKEFMPVFDERGNLKPLILANVEEALAAGVEEIAVIVQEDERPLFDRLFSEPVRPGILDRLSPENQEYAARLQRIGEHITLIPQQEQKGLGHAILSAKAWIGDEPFLLVLGDHYFSSKSDLPCASQLVEAYESSEEIVIGLVPAPASESYRFGCATGEWVREGRVLSITRMVEKPDPDFARQYLTGSVTDADSVLTVFGLYVLKPIVLQYIERTIQEHKLERGEIGLTSALEELRTEIPLRGIVLDGERIDIGVPSAYEKAMTATIRIAAQASGA
jgi:UTP-glucose-1-phosphate uridylyltransferase/mevalonate kinase